MQTEINMAGLMDIFIGFFEPENPENTTYEEHTEDEQTDESDTSQYELEENINNLHVKEYVEISGSDTEM
jgi:hypothetical protein